LICLPSPPLTVSYLHLLCLTSSSSSIPITPGLQTYRPSVLFCPVSWHTLPLFSCPPSNPFPFHIQQNLRGLFTLFSDRHYLSSRLLVQRLTFSPTSPQLALPMSRYLAFSYIQEFIYFLSVIRATYLSRSARL